MCFDHITVPITYCNNIYSSIVFLFVRICAGQVTIEFHVEKETNFIVLHSQDLNITEKVCTTTIYIINRQNFNFLLDTQINLPMVIKYKLLRSVIGDSPNGKFHLIQFRLLIFNNCININELLFVNGRQLSVPKYLH